MSYLIWKFLHIVSVVIFLGNILTGLFWAAHARKTRDFRLIASTFQGITRSDRLFTMPGVIGIVVSGVAAAMIGNWPILGTGWILWGISLFIMSGAVFGMKVAPLQRKIYDLAASGDGSDQSWEKFEEAYKQWKLWGHIALILPFVAAAIMVLKPPLPGF